MATTKERFEAIEGRLIEIEARSGISPTPNKRSQFWPQTLTEWATVIGTGLAIIAAAISASLYIGSLMLDRHIETAISPLQSEINRIDGDVRELKGKISVLPAQIATERLSSVPPKELKQHQAELIDLKQRIASADKAASNYWQTSFEIIHLVSLASSYIENRAPTHSSFENAHDVRVVHNGDVVELSGIIANSTFEKSVVSFQPNVQLRNVTFIDCVFIFPSLPNPPENLQKIAISLLSGETNRATITAS